MRELYEGVSRTDYKYFSEIGLMKVSAFECDRERESVRGCV